MNKHKETKLIKENGKTAVLFIHGFLESPCQFEDFMEIASEKHTVYSVLLDGHGGNVNDFRKSNYNTWVDSVDKFLLELRDSNQKVFVVSHSMGGLIALRLLGEYSDVIQELFMISVPLRIWCRLSGMRNGLRIALSKNQNDPKLTAGRNVHSVTVDNIFQYVFYIPKLWNLFKLSRLSRENVDKVSVPVTLINTKHDEYVSIRSNKFFSNMENVDKLFLENSAHFYFEKTDRKILLELFKKKLEGFEKRV